MLRTFLIATRKTLRFVIKLKKLCLFVTCVERTEKIMISKSFQISEKIYNEVSDFVSSNIVCKKESHSKRIVRLSMESITSLISHKNPEVDQIDIAIKNIFGTVQVVLSCKGEKFNFLEDSSLGIDLNNEDLAEDSDGIIRTILLSKFSEHISYKYSKKTNIVTLTEEKHEHTEVAYALGALVLGIMFGLILKNMVPSGLSDGLLNMFLEPFRTIYVDAMKLLVGPIVFLAMVCCISQFKSIAEIGKIGIRLMGMYLFTTVLAVCIGFLLFSIFPVGSPEIAQKLSGVVEEITLDEEENEELIEASEYADSGSAFSIKETIVEIVPDNIITPFKENNLLQILFLAILVGIGVSIISNQYPGLKKMFEGLNEVFLSLMGILCKLIPLAIFCNMSALIYEMGFDILESIVGFMILSIGGIVCMMLIYNLLIFVFAGLNPIPFIKKFSRTSITALSLSSSTAAMPFSLDSCKALGISNKVASFAIPLGSTINMDGSSLVMSIACLFMARIFNIEITPALLVSVLISVVLLSLGAPSMAGADLAIIAILISQIGVPVYAIALIMGIDTILDMCQAMSNTTGDAAVALIVAKRTGLLDVKKYYEG